MPSTTAAAAEPSRPSYSRTSSPPGLRGPLETRQLDVPAANRPRPAGARAEPKNSPPPASRFSRWCPPVRRRARLRGRRIQPRCRITHDHFRSGVGYVAAACEQARTGNFIVASGNRSARNDPPLRHERFGGARGAPCVFRRPGILEEVAALVGCWVFEARSGFLDLSIRERPRRPRFAVLDSRPSIQERLVPSVLSRWAVRPRPLDGELFPQASTSDRMPDAMDERQPPPSSQVEQGFLFERGTVLIAGEHEARLTAAR